MFRKSTGLVLVCLALYALPGIAAAYIGPGAGITFIGALVGVVLAVASAVGFILFWPFRRAWRRMKGKKESTEAAKSHDTPPAEEEPEGEEATAEN
jgi:uncharacterized membrane protein